MLVVKNLHVYYGLIEAVKGIDFKVETGHIVSLIGSNGDETALYFYTCECVGQIHDVPFGIHQKIQLKGAKFK
ncbi:hypothetical protein VWM73_09145, partial [Campylobacter coli]